jgi:hypothetical protein
MERSIRLTRRTELVKRHKPCSWWWYFVVYNSSFRFYPSSEYILFKTTMFRLLVLLPSSGEKYKNELYSAVHPSYWLLLWGGIVQGVPRTATIFDLLCVPIWVLIIPYPSERALWQITAQAPSSEAGRYLERNGREFCLQVFLFITYRGMRPTAYIPFEGNRATDFIALKNPSSSAGLKTRTLGPVASTITIRPPRMTPCPPGRASLSLT